jgi:uncharacterized membrane protein YhaH (DUF805 family)
MKAGKALAKGYEAYWLAMWGALTLFVMAVLLPVMVIGMVFERERPEGKDGWLALVPGIVLYGSLFFMDRHNVAPTFILTALACFFVYFIKPEKK